MVLFDDPGLQVVYLEGSSDALVVTFSSLGMFKPGGGSVCDGKTFWGRQFVEKTDLSAIGFVAKRPHWFIIPSMREALSVARAHTALFRDIVTYGSSMGGFAALKFSAALNATAAISCGPQATLDNSLLPIPDPRYQHHFKLPVHAGMRIEAADVCEKAFVIYDPFCAIDRVHAMAIMNAAPQTSLIPAYFAGHECVRLFGSTASASRLIELGAAHDRNALIDWICKLRRNSPVRALELALLVENRRPQLSSAIAEKYQIAWDAGQRARFSQQKRWAGT